MLVLHKQKENKILSWTLEIVRGDDLCMCVRITFGRIKLKYHPLLGNSRPSIERAVATSTLVRTIRDKWSKGYRPVVFNINASNDPKRAWDIIMDRLPPNIREYIIAIPNKPIDKPKAKISKALQTKEESVAIARDREDRFGFILEEIINE